MRSERERKSKGNYAYRIGLLTSNDFLEEKRQMAARKAENEKKKNERMIKRKCKSEQN